MEVRCPSAPRPGGLEVFIEAEAVRKWGTKRLCWEEQPEQRWENLHGKCGPGHPAPWREGGRRGEWGLCVHCPQPDHGRPAWQHGAPRLHSSTWSLPETQPPSGWSQAVWLGREAPGTPKVVNSRIVGLESRFQGHALGRLSGWGERAMGQGESSPQRAIWNPSWSPLENILTPVRSSGQNQEGH